MACFATIFRMRDGPRLLALDPTGEAASRCMQQFVERAPPNAGAWHPACCAAGLVFAAALYFSWLAPPTRRCWDALDLAVYHLFNPTLAAAGAWQSFWAVANWRPFDLVTAAIIFTFVLAWLRAGGSRHAHARLAQFLAFCVLLLIGKAVDHLLLDLAGYRRQSPTLVFPDAVRLSELVTWVQVKDRGSTVFPGDHAFVIFATVGFIRICIGRGAGWLAALLLVPFTLPRLVIGAHWLTDIAVGGLGMALVLLALAYGTPFAARLASLISRRARWLIDFSVWTGRKVRLLR
jgi:membrane-associated phospholipid phosphatase